MYRSADRSFLGMYNINKEEELVCKYDFLTWNIYKFNIKNLKSVLKNLRKFVGINHNKMDC